ncbi:HGL168Cp [Eremothecium sinecaudum]|uniref:Sorting nexin-4 n=1 Tax=Eremothecium sinecaudum TaxID=45286 RepID=A0A120K2P5_9SACH|nr:HGL168Cp [Eremothecium sinecaudum]AMD22172.1 HGL168Cp [Eremothecium sinecaudum]
MSGVKLCDEWNILVSDPQKQRGVRSSASSSSFVTYQISLKAIGSKATGSDSDDNITVVYRRYSDFVLLHQVLVSDHTACIVPPLPDKKVLNYIAGDRFSQAFTQKRCHSLQNFLQRLGQHPKLSQSKIFYIFLTSPDWDTYRRNLAGVGSTSNKEEVSEVIMNAFKSVHNQSDEFAEIKERSDKLDHNVTKIDKLFHRVVKKQESIAEDYSRLGNSLLALQELSLSPSEANGYNPNALGEKIKIFNEGMSQMSYSLRDLSKYIEYEYIVDLRDMEHYIDSVKQMIKLKDQKQIDYEELSEYLARSVNEKNNLISGYGSGSNFFKSKLEELAGINQEAARREKIYKLESKVQSLTLEVSRAKVVADAFEKEALKEVDVFEQIKTRELKKSLTMLADHHIGFYEKMVNTWSKIEEAL